MIHQNNILQYLLDKIKPFWETYVNNCPYTNKKDIYRYIADIEEPIKVEIANLISNIHEDNPSLEITLEEIWYKVKYYMTIKFDSIINTF